MGRGGTARTGWGVLAVVSLVIALDHVAAPQPAGTDAVLGIRVGSRIAEVTVPARGATRTVPLMRYAGQEVVVVVTRHYTPSALRPRRRRYH